MALEQLTNLQLKNITEQNLYEVLRDGGGLRGRVRKDRTGRVIIYFEHNYRCGKKLRTAYVGEYPASTLAEIRAAHRALKVNLKNGIDPIDDRQNSKQQARLEQAKTAERQKEEMLRLAAENAARKSFADAIESWAKHELSRRKDGGEEAMRAIRKDVLPLLGNVAITDVTRRMLLEVLDPIVTRGAKVMANHLFADLSQFFSFAVRRDWVPAHPLAGFKKEHIGGKQKERTRHLSEAEIIELQQKLPNARLKPTTKNAIWIMLSTLCRVGEISKARWEDVDLEKGEWRIPVENSKNSESLLISLSGFANERFAELKVLTGNTPWCLPNSDGENHICLKSITKQVKDRQTDTPQANRTKNANALTLLGGSWTPHDLRRTGSTLMGELGINSDVIERCMNHVEQNKLKRIYQQYEYKTEKQEAWHKLGERLDLILNPKRENILIGKFSKGA